MSSMDAVISPHASVAPPATRRRERTTVQALVVFLVFLLISIIPLLTHPLPPLEDYANHVSRMQVLADHGQNPNLAKYYEIDWELLPNLMMDLIVPWIAKVVNVYLASQIFTMTIFALIMSGTFALNRALFGRWSMLPLIAFPLLYNYMFLIGILNYFFGVGLALWALASWILLREKAWPTRYILSAVFAFALYLCHLFAVGVYGLGLLAFEIYYALSVDRSPWPQRVLKFCCAGLPFAPLMGCLLTSSTWDHAKEWDWESAGKLDGLMFVINTYSDIIAFVLTMVVIAGAFMAMRLKLLRIHPLMVPLLFVGGLIYVALPRMLFASYLADQRLPIALAFMVVACARIDFLHENMRRLFLVGTLGLLGARVAEVDIAWANASPATLQMKESLRKVAKGSKILVAYTDSNMPNETEHLGLVHAVSLAILERQALITTAFTTSGKQIMHVRPQFRKIVDTEDGTPPTIDELVLDAVGRGSDDTSYWHDWAKTYDYVYLLFTDEDSDNPMPDKLKTLYEGDNFQLYRIIKPGMDKNAPDMPKKPIRMNPAATAAAAGQPAPGSAPVPAQQVAAPQAAPVVQAAPAVQAAAVPVPPQAAIAKP
jgi:hypothetical protein